jgi:hypothetical protein
MPTPSPTDATPANSGITRKTFNVPVRIEQKVAVGCAIATFAAAASGEAGSGGRD